MIDLVDYVVIDFIEISPKPDSLCPENSLCGQLERHLEFT